MKPGFTGVHGVHACTPVWGSISLTRTYELVTCMYIPLSERFRYLVVTKIKNSGDTVGVHACTPVPHLTRGNTNRGARKCVPHLTRGNTETVWRPCFLRSQISPPRSHPCGADSATHHHLVDPQKGPSA